MSILFYADLSRAVEFSDETRTGGKAPTKSEGPTTLFATLMGGPPYDLCGPIPPALPFASNWRELDCPADLSHRRSSRPCFKSAVALLCVVCLCVFMGCAANDVQQDAMRTPTDNEVARIRYNMAETLVKKRDYEAAAPYIRDLLSRHPKNARLHLLLGIVLREKGVLRAAEKEIKIALQLKPKNPEAHAALGVLLLKDRRWGEAEKHHRTAVKLAPHVARYHNDLGFCLLSQQRYELAAGEFEEAIRIDPTFRRAYNNLGFALGLMDQVEAAQRAFGQAGSREMALTNMGYVEELRGKPQSARRYYERALRVRHGYPPALNNLRRLDPSRQMETDDDTADHLENIDHGTKGSTETTPGAAAAKRGEQATVEALSVPAAPQGITTPSDAESGVEVRDGFEE